MPDTNQPDWFSQNAAPIAPGGSDWFSSNAPAAQQEQPSTWQKLTAGYDPGAAEFAEKHPVLGAPVRFLSAAGGAALATPGAVASSFIHPIDTAKAVGKQVSDAYKYYAPAALGGDPNQHPSWEAIKSVAPEALGTGTGTVAAGEATGIAQKAALRPVINTLKDVPLTGWKPLAERAAPRMEAAGNEARATVGASLKAAEARVAPLYKNMEKADQDDLAASGKPGSVDISKATKALEDARQRMYGAEPGPRVVQKEAGHLAQYAPNETTTLADMKTARGLRSQLSDEIGSAIAKGDRQTASALSAAKTEVTNAMAERAKNLGLEKDFATADPQWREIQGHRERLAPITQEENSAKLFDTYRKASPEMRNSLDALDKAGLLDKDALDRLGKATGRVQSAQEGGNFLPWIKRAAYGVVPYEIAEKTGLIPKLGISPYILGGAGATLGIAGIRRLLAERALSELPELENRGPGLRAVTPGTPTLPTIPPEAAPRPVGPTPGGIPPISDEAMLRMRVPLAEQPTPGERPFENMLNEVRQETQENPQGRAERANAKKSACHAIAKSADEGENPRSRRAVQTDRPAGAQAVHRRPAGGTAESFGTTGKAETSRRAYRAESARAAEQD